MSIYRGPGGSGDAVNDSSSEATLVAQLVGETQADADAAAASATAAAGSASTAATQATNATNSATAAASSASSASTSASNASTSATNASNSATSASTSASTATTQATNAASSASAASTSATNASNSASAASTSATNASNSETAAAASAAAAAASFDAFDDIYLGAKASNPTVDNDGNALTTGDQYFNTVANELRVWNGSSWQAASVIGGTVTTLDVTGSAAFASISDSGNLTFTGTGNRIRGDFSNATIANRVIFQTSTTNGASNVGVIPNGTGVVSLFTAFNNSDPTNCSTAQLGNFNSEVSVRSGITGTGTYLPLTMWTGASERLRIDTSGNVGIGGVPFDKLDVYGGATIRGAIGSTGASITLSNASNSYAPIEINNGTARIAMTTNSASTELRTITNHPQIFMTNNTERMRIDSIGNVGIGLSNPAVLADINGVMRATAWSLSGTGVAGGTTRFSAGTVSTDGNWGYYFRAPTSSSAIAAYSFRNPADTEFMRIDASGNVGIGTSSPSAKLQSTVNSATQINNIIENSVSYLNYGVFGTGENYIYSGSAHPLLIGTNNTERMRITSTGDVGIGTTSPLGILDARGSVYFGNPAAGTTAFIRGGPNWNFASLSIVRNAANTGTPRSIGMALDGDDLASTVIGAYNAIWGAYDSSPTTGSTSSALNGAMVYGAYAGHRWFTNGTERMRIDSSGNVGIGTSSPAARLTVVTSTTNNGIAVNDGTINSLLYNSGTAGVGIVGTTTNHPFVLFANNVERMRIDSSGQLHIGRTGFAAGTLGNSFGLNASGLGYNESVSTNAGGTLALWYMNRQSSTGTMIAFRQASTDVGSISVTASATAYNTSSDYRLKENIIDAPLGNIDDIKVRSFDWIADGTHQDFGVVAQELVEVAPYAVHQPQDPEEMMAVDYSKLVPMMIKEIQDLKQRIKTLESN